MLQEILSNPPHSYIFHEPWFHIGCFQNPQYAEADLKEWVDIKALAQGCSSTDAFLSALMDHIPVVGVKEIDLKLSSVYLKMFPDARVVLIGRDPKDIYESHRMYAERHQGGKLADDFLIQFMGDAMSQIELSKKASNVMCIKYEDLCRNPVWWTEKLALFAGIPEQGEIGHVHKKLIRGDYEMGVHGGKITDKSVDKEHSPEAEEFAGKMVHYRRFWGYE